MRVNGRTKQQKEKKARSKSIVKKPNKQSETKNEKSFL